MGGFDAGFDEFVNKAPVAFTEAYTVSAGTPLSVSAALGVLANDSDANGNSLTAVLGSPPLTGTLALAPDGEFVYTPSRWLWRLRSLHLSSQ